MSDTRVNNNLVFPKVPESLTDDQKQYFNDLERLLRQLLGGDINVVGNLFVGGEIYTRNAAGELQQLTDLGHVGH